LKKIDYFLCKNADEIKLVTGFDTRGMYYIPYDYVVTTYNCHYHELLHLLMNYKLRSLPLYTTPLLQEGFAVAFGGRGGLNARVVLETGAYLVNAGFLTYDSLLNKESFYRSNASLSYPVAGIYNKFLVSSLGIKKYLNLYMKYSGGSEVADTTSITTDDLPPDSAWKHFMDDFENEKSIVISDTEPAISGRLIRDGKTYSIFDHGDYYFFNMKDILLISSNERYDGYRSRKFAELFPSRTYRSEKYAIVADSDEVSVYNLFTNDLIAEYSRGFSVSALPVPTHDGHFEFEVRKEVFDRLPFRQQFKISN